MPGGSANHGENHLAEVKRELLEETGYGSDNWHARKAFSYPSGRIVFSYYYFIARNCKKLQKQNLDPGEKVKVRFFVFDQFLRLGETTNYRGFGMSKFLLEMRLNAKKQNEFQGLLFPEK